MAVKCAWRCPSRSQAVDATRAAWRGTCRRNACTPREVVGAVADSHMRPRPRHLAMEAAVVHRLLRAIRPLPARIRRALVRLTATTRGTTRTLGLALHRATTTEERPRHRQRADMSRGETTEAGRRAETGSGTEATTEAGTSRTIRRHLSHADHMAADTTARHHPARHLPPPTHLRHQRMATDHHLRTRHRRPAAQAVAIIDAVVRVRVM